MTIKERTLEIADLEIYNLKKELDKVKSELSTHKQTLKNLPLNNMINSFIENFKSIADNINDVEDFEDNSDDIVELITEFNSIIDLRELQSK